jgi:hypothetical protein
MLRPSSIARAVAEIGASNREFRVGQSATFVPM